VDFVVCKLAVEKKIRACFGMSDQTIPLSVSETQQILKCNNSNSVSSSNKIIQTGMLGLKY
jgi:hypothetical protein